MKVAVLGGGISGLVTAFYLRQACPRSCQVTLLEGSHRLGGWLNSYRSPQGFVFEKSCRSIRPAGVAKTALIELLGETGAWKDALPSDSAAKTRYIFHNDELCPMPKSAVEYARWKLLDNRWSWVWNELTQNAIQTTVDESVRDFFCRRFSDEIADKIVDPFISGIYAGNASQLSMRSVFPSVYQLEKKHRSVLYGFLVEALSNKSTTCPVEYGGLENKNAAQAVECTSLSFTEGLSTLPNSLASYLEHDSQIDIKLMNTVRQISRDTDGGLLTVTYENSRGQQRSDEFDHVVSTLPSQQLAQTLPISMGRCTNILRTIPHASVAAVNVGWLKPASHVLPMPPAFGFLVPSSQWANFPRGVLGMTFDSCVFPTQNLDDQSTNETRLTVMIGGSNFPHILEMSTEEIEELALDALQHMNVNDKPDFIQVNLAKSAIPQYTIGHSERISQISRELSPHFPNLHINSNWTDGVGVSDCLRRSRELAIQISRMK